MTLRDGVFVQRPQATYEGLTNVRGLGLWHDTANNVWRLIATDVNAGVYKMYVKGTSGETWGADVSSSNAPFGTILDSISYRGKFLASVASAAGGKTPLRVIYYDGTTYDRDADLPFAGVYSLAVIADRVVYGGVRLTGSNLASDITVYAYDPSLWTATATTTSTITANGTTLYRITPTNTTTSQVALVHPTGVSNFFGNGSESIVQFRVELRGVDQVIDMPMTAQIKYSSARADSTAYTVGQVIVVAASAGFRFRCTVAGTSAGAAPAFSTTTGATTTDGGVTWICDGSDVASAKEFTVPNISRETRWTEAYTVAKIPDGAKTDLTLVVKFGTEDIPTITLAPVDFGYLDGRAAADPLKQNRGQQTEIGPYAADFFFPFFSNETTANVTINRSDTIYVSDPLEPLRVRSSASFNMRQQPGDITAARVVAHKLYIFKREAHTVFGVTDDFLLPILPEGDAHVGTGVLNPKALVVSERGTMYGIGENYLWRMRPGGEPEDICGPAMRREMFNKSSASWVEAQSAPANRALLVYDQRNKRLLAYTQKGKLYAYDIDSGSWSVYDFGGGDAVSAVGYEICDMAYNPNTDNVYIAFSSAATGTAGLARLDETQAGAEDGISSSGTLPVYAELWPRAIEANSSETDLQIDTLRFRHAITANQTNQTTTGYVSTDGGVTFPKSLAFTAAPLSTGAYRPIEYPLFQSWHTIQPRIVHAGKGGAENFSVSGIEADIQVMRGFYPKDKPTFGASTL